MPAPIQPIDAPQLRCVEPSPSAPVPESPPNPAPMFGVNNQSARAVPGKSTSDRAAIIAHFFNIAFLLDRGP
jgi:hypothetical protein